MIARATVLVTGLAAVSLTAIPAWIRLPPKLVWNASASVPIGLYAVRSVGSLEITDLVVARPPEPLAGVLDQGGYLPKGVPLIKRVLALPGQTVCRENLLITVDGTAMGLARERDRRGRPLPVWRGCRALAHGEVFLMNRGEPDSLDGRYFGPLPAASIIGRAAPLLTFVEE